MDQLDREEQEILDAYMQGRLEEDSAFAERYYDDCAGCDDYGKVDDVGLCEECGAKLDRDMIRERHWERSVSAWLCPKDKREELRRRVVKKHGAKLELIAPAEPARRKKARSGKKRSRGRRS